MIELAAPQGHPAGRHRVGPVARPTSSTSRTTSANPARPDLSAGPPGRSASPPAALGAGRVAMAGLGLAIAVATLVSLVTGGPLQGPAAVAFAALGPGLALLSHLRVGDPATRWALAVLTSVAGYVAVATGAAWIGWWQPRTVATIGAAAMAVACLAALARAIRTRRRPARPEEAVPQRRPVDPNQAGPDRARRRATPTPAATVRSGGGRSGGGRGLAAHAVVLAGAVALWLIALARTDVTQVGEYGLLASVHPAYLGAVALCAIGFAAGLLRAGGPSAALPAYPVLLIVILHATTPLLLDQPQYAWTYKHLGVIELIRSTGAVGAPDDIYQQWPALFAAVAQLADLSGVTAAGLADWSAVFFNLAGALVLFAIARTLSADVRVAHLTVFGFLAVNWVEEDYLSPQALAFLLSLGVLLVLLRWLRRPAAGTADPAGMDPAGTDPDQAGSRRTRAVALVGLLAIFAVLTAGHQLSPYLVLAQVAVLVVLRQVRPWWTPLLMGGILLAYLWPRYGLVSGSFGLFEGINIFANAAGNAEGWGSAGQAFSAVVVRALALTVWGLAALAVLRARRRPRTVLVPAVLAATPFVLLAGQSYGGEAIYRVFLFSAPWCAYLIAASVFAPRAGRDPRASRASGTPRSAPARPRWSARRTAGVALLGLALGVAALATVQGRHGQLVVDRQSAAEVRAARHLYATAEPGSTIALGTSNFPSRLTGDYGRFNRTVPVGEPDLVKGADLRDTPLGAEYLPAIENYLRGFGGTATYLVLSDGMDRQADYFGYLPDGALDRLGEALAADPDWTVFHRDGDVVVYQFTG
nr:hypothetical protein [Micromonospora sp. DSM 115978]